MQADSNPELLVVLVHGTWGRGIFPALTSRFSKKRWFQVGSTFRQQLGQELMATNGMSVEFSEFLWSGSNSFVEREKASSALQSHLMALAHQFPRTVIAIIAHSHGGNVMLSALSNLPAVLRKLRLVSLATPYLSARTYNENAPQLKSLNYIWAMMILYLSLGIRQFIASGIAGFQSLLLHTLVLFLVFGLLRGFREKPLRIETVSSISDADLLVLRAVDDEAGLALLLGNLIHWSSSIGIYLLHMISKGAVWALMAFLIGFVIFAVGEVSGVIPFVANDWFALNLPVLVMALLLFVVEVCIPLMLGLLVVTAVGRSINGREFFFGGVLHEVNLQSVPDVSGCSITVETLPPSDAAFGLRHSLYQHPLCVSRIAQRLAASIQATTPPDSAL